MRQPVFNFVMHFMQKFAVVHDFVRFSVCFYALSRQKSSRNQFLVFLQIQFFVVLVSGSYKIEIFCIKSNKFSRNYWIESIRLTLTFVLFLRWIFAFLINLLSIRRFSMVVLLQLLDYLHKRIVNSLYDFKQIKYYAKLYSMIDKYIPSFGSFCINTLHWRVKHSFFNLSIFCW